MHKRRADQYGWLFIIAGLLLIILFASDILLRFLILLISIALINHGMRSLGFPDLFFFFRFFIDLIERKLR